MDGRNMLDEDLNYSGAAWPTAQVIDSGEIKFVHESLQAGPELPEEPPSKPELWFQIEAAGREKPWTATKPQAFWRSLEDLRPSTDASHGERAADFVRRFGPVIEPAYNRLETNTRNWPEVSYLAKVAKAWEPADADGLSRLSANRMRRDTARHWLARFILPIAMHKVEITLDAELRPVLQARTLYAFMALSAASALRRQAVMRRCAHCQFWFEPPRTDALYCSSACRTAYHAAQGEKKLVASARKPAARTPKKVRARG
jgi:hypothetical protein